MRDAVVRRDGGHFRRPRRRARLADQSRRAARAVQVETVALAERLMKLNPEAIRATKQAVKHVRNMSEAALDYLAAKSIELRLSIARRAASGDEPVPRRKDPPAGSPARPAGGAS